MRKVFEYIKDLVLGLTIFWVPLLGCIICGWLENLTEKLMNGEQFMNLFIGSIGLLCVGMKIYLVFIERRK